MYLKKSLPLIVLFSYFAVLDASTPLSRELLEKAFSKKSEMLDALVDVLKPKAEELREEFQAFGDCEKNTRTKNWMQWRAENLMCGAEKKRPDEFRRHAVKKIEAAVTEIMVNSKMIPSEKFEEKTAAKIESTSLNWIAIGTPGPNSDIDTVGILDDETYEHIKEGTFLPKTVAEVRGKSLFDALGVAVFGQPLGVIFDTESYIDVTDDLHKTQYEKRISQPSYQNLAFTLAFVQLARQLHHPIVVGGKSVIDFSSVQSQFVGSHFLPLLEDAASFSILTYPEKNSKSNIRKYLPIINFLADSINASSDSEYRARFKGVLGTYFPEAYYTREALAHVCYSDDEFSQMMLTLISEYWKGGDADEIPLSKIQEFKNKTITPNDFVFVVSALENFGYMLHRLDNGVDTYESLKNASKYFFRVTRALVGYFSVPEFTLENREKDTKTQKYVRSLYHIAAKLERLKRGYLPFASPNEAELVIRKVDLFLKKKTSDETMQKWANEIFRLHTNKYVSASRKRGDLKAFVQNFKGAINEEDNKFVPTNSALNNEGVLELIALLDLVAGIDSDTENTKTQKEIKENQVKLSRLPSFEGKSPSKPIGEMKDSELRESIMDLISFLKMTAEDFAKKNSLSPQSIQLTAQTKALIQEAI